MRKLTDTATRIAEGQLEHEAAIEGTVEVRRLAGAFNSMTGELRKTLEGLEQRVAERTDELRQSNQALQTLIQASPLPIIAVDRDARIRTWNPAAEQTFHWSEEEIHDRPFKNL